MKVICAVRCGFSAAHFYYQPQWSDEKNSAFFGKCFSPYGHGHNYNLEVGFENPTTPVSGLKDLVQKTTDYLDHHHLNFVVPEFFKSVPTTENIAIYLLKNLQVLCPTESISYIKLFETDDLWVEIKA